MARHGGGDAVVCRRLRWVVPIRYPIRIALPEARLGEVHDVRFVWWYPSG